MKFFNKKISLVSIVTLLILSSTTVHAQIEKVIVETYYVADSLDATDTTGHHILVKGSKTYRVYIDMAKGSKLKKIFGSPTHPLSISSTANFYNNTDRPNEYFGYLIKKNYFSSNPLLALDSWLTLGLATTVGNGVLKPQDTDGSLIGGTHNSGGSAGVAGGLLVNNDPAAGIPLTSEDGFLTNTAVLSTWSDNGFRNGVSTSALDTTVFGSVKTGSSFYSTSAFLQQNAGVMGAIADSNQVLVAQLSTLGTLSFALNATIIDSSGNQIDYVAQSISPATGDTVLSPFLTYPSVCGCTDTKYLEYSNTYSCSNAAACHTLKVFGCTDSMACNYDPNANVLLPNFCCYPGYCNDRDISLVCPNLSPYKSKTELTVNNEIYPNPVQNTLSLGLIYTSNLSEVSYIIYDAFYNRVVEKNLGVIPGNSIIRSDVADLPDGLYLFRITVGGSSTIKKFIKN